MSRLRLLLVEDDPDVRDAIQLGLSDAFDVSVAANGTEGLAMTDTHTFDVLVLDLMMPGMDGLAFMRTLREKGVRVPTVLASASPLAASLARELAITDYLVKPFSLRQLESKLARVCEQTFTSEERTTQEHIMTATPPATNGNVTKA